MDINDILTANINGRLGEMGKTPNWLQQQISPTSSGVFDFLNKNRPNRSMKVDMLSRIADALEIPVTALLLPPDRREPASEILRILHSGEPVLADAVGGLIGDLVEIAARERKPGPAGADTAGAKKAPRDH